MSLKERWKRGKKKEMIPKNDDPVKEFQDKARNEVGGEKTTNILGAKTVNDARVKASWNYRMTAMLNQIRWKRKNGMSLTPQEQFVFDNKTMFPGGGD